MRHRPLFFALGALQAVQNGWILHSYLIAVRSRLDLNVLPWISALAIFYVFKFVFGFLGDRFVILGGSYAQLLRWILRLIALIWALAALTFHHFWLFWALMLVLTCAAVALDAWVFGYLMACFPSDHHADLLAANAIGYRLVSGLVMGLILWLSAWSAWTSWFWGFGLLALIFSFLLQDQKVRAPLAFLAYRSLTSWRLLLMSSALAFSDYWVSHALSQSLVMQVSWSNTELAWYVQMLGAGLGSVMGVFMASKILKWCEVWGALRVAFFSGLVWVIIWLHVQRKSEAVWLILFWFISSSARNFITERWRAQQVQQMMPGAHFAILESAAALASFVAALGVSLLQVWHQQVLLMPIGVGLFSMCLLIII